MKTYYEDAHFLMDVKIKKRCFLFVDQKQILEIKSQMGEHFNDLEHMWVCVSVCNCIFIHDTWLFSHFIKFKFSSLFLFCSNEKSS